MIIKILIEGNKTNLEVKENKDKSVYVKGAKEVHINNPSEVFKVIDEGQANRHVAATGINTYNLYDQWSPWRIGSLKIHENM